MLSSFSSECVAMPFICARVTWENESICVQRYCMSLRFSWWQFKYRDYDAFLVALHQSEIQMFKCALLFLKKYLQ